MLRNILKRVLFLFLFSSVGLNVRYAEANDEGNICKFGYHDYGDKYLVVNNRKLGSKPCYVAGGFGDKETRIFGGINAWNSRINQYGNKNKISLVRIANKSAAKIHIKKSYLGKHTAGLTHFFVGNKEINSNPKLSQNYDFVTIQLNTDVLSSNDTTKVAAHELGHALGLTHQFKDKKSIMHNYYDKTEVQIPAKIDVKTIMHIYN